MGKPAIMIFLSGLVILFTLVTFGCRNGQRDGGPRGQSWGQPVRHDEAASPFTGPAHHDHGPGEGGGSAPVMSLASIAAARCEHDMATYKCDECRYEVGVVKVPATMLPDSPSAEGAILSTAVVTRQSITSELDVTGEIQLNENAAVHISPRIPGVIERVHVDIGAHVHSGDILFQISSVELGKALGDHGLSSSLAELSRQNYVREKALWEQNIASEQDMIAAQMTYEQHRAELAAAVQTLRVYGLSEKDVAQLGERAVAGGVGSLPVRAPIEGTIIQKHAVVGELVEPGRDVMLLADLRSVWVWADIYESDLPRLLAVESQEPVPVQVLVTAYPERIFAGFIDYIGATMQEATRTVKVRAAVENPEALLRPGMFCEVKVGLGQDGERLAIPRMALLTDEGEDFVFKHWQDDYFVRCRVRKGHEFGDTIEIQVGLEAGDLIVVKGAFLLKSDVLREKMGAGCAD